MEHHVSEQKVALVLGATGGVGGAIARRLSKAGWKIRALHRSPSKVEAFHTDFDWIAGDAMSATDVASASVGANLIVHAVNPPGYKDWDKVVLPMLENSIEAARINNSRLFVPGGVYNFGPDTWTDIAEDSPQRPITRKGAIRAEMERRLRIAAEGGVRVLILRTGDFFGPQAANNWFSQGLVKTTPGGRKVTHVGRDGVGHQWAYLPDVAETVAQLIARDGELPSFAVFNMQGVWDHDGRQMIKAILHTVGASAKVSRFPWWMVAVGRPFVPFFREVYEMRYLWTVPVRLRNDRLREFLGKEPHTPLDQAVRATLAALG
ncbi:SDR family NAD(P)-dependent oxidoreductase [Oryzifoliimicrobium ureilyticus]|uniref:SDR family NAD(P)-dependent oxidoreductase n=1 Tax=Oryzifoliimicrobium ureilyticus TaxID=3113724 RepID=UPI003075EF58